MSCSVIIYLEPPPPCHSHILKMGPALKWTLGPLSAEICILSAKNVLSRWTATSEIYTILILKIINRLILVFQNNVSFFMSSSIYSNIARFRFWAVWIYDFMIDYFYFVLWKYWRNMIDFAELAMQFPLCYQCLPYIILILLQYTYW